MMAGLRRVGKRWWVGGCERVDRLAIAVGRRLGGRRARLAAAVTGEFPLYFHTFVYQELMSLHRGLAADVKVFYLLDGDPGVLGRSFQYLWWRRTKLPNAREIWAADFEHYRFAMPDRVASLLAAIADETGRTVDDLARDPELHRAFTFARKVELYGGTYLHSYFFYAESLGALVAQWLLKKPRGITAYADHVLDDWPLKVVRLHLTTADVVVATSDRARDELLAIGGETCRDKILVKPNGVDGQRFPFVERSRGAGEPLRLISVSRLEPKKGLLDLLDAVAELVERGVSVRLQLVGATDPGQPESANYEAALRERVRELDLDDVVTMPGRRNHRELLPLVKKAHVFVAPYVELDGGDKDGIPTAILEGMSSGLPIVATDAGAIREVIEDRVEGRIVPQRSPEALADALAELARDAELAASWGRAARVRFDRDFDVAVTEGRLHARIRPLADFGEWDEPHEP